MFILDKNVVSELMRPVPEPALKSWIADCTASSMYLTSVREAELRFDLAVMPSGHRPPERWTCRKLGTDAARRLRG